LPVVTACEFLGGGTEQLPCRYRLVTVWNQQTAIKATIVKATIVKATIVKATIVKATIVKATIVR
jgi:hypothetical protein